MLRITLTCAAFIAASLLSALPGIAGDAYHAGGHSVGSGIQQAGYYEEEDPGRPLSAWECWWEDMRDCCRARRLRGYKRVQKKHRKFLYPEFSVACSPTFGYHHTQWRQFPECEYVWSSEPAATTWPTPVNVPQSADSVSPPAILSPRLEDAPSATTPTEPYFPEPAPQLIPLQPAVPPAPPAEPPLDSGAAFQPARTDSLIEFVAHPRAN